MLSQVLPCARYTGTTWMGYTLMSSATRISISTIMLTCRVRPRIVVFRSGFKPLSSLLAMRSTSRRAVSSSCLALLASPDSAGGDLGRDRAVSRRGVLLSTAFHNLYRYAFLPRSPINSSSSLQYSCKLLFNHREHQEDRVR